MKAIPIVFLLLFCVAVFGQELMITDGSLDFHDNAIERAYETEWQRLDGSPEFTTAACITLEQKYLEIWDRELNHFYQALLKKLPPDKRNMLIEAQRAWLDHFEKEKRLLNELLNLDFMNGSWGRVEFVRKLGSEKKARVYELIEYYYMFGGKITFLFDASSAR